MPQSSFDLVMPVAKRVGGSVWTVHSTRPTPAKTYPPMTISELAAAALAYTPYERSDRLRAAWAQPGCTDVHREPLE